MFIHIVGNQAGIIIIVSGMIDVAVGLLMLLMLLLLRLSVWMLLMMEDGGGGGNPRCSCVCICRYLCDNIVLIGTRCGILPL